MASDGTVAARLLVEVGARGLNETAAGLGVMGATVDRTSAGIGGLVRAAGGIYAIKKGFDATIGSAIAWESEFAGVEKTVDGTVGELAALEGELLQMNRTMPIARGELAGIAEAAGALGISTQDISEFTEVVAMIGETTNVSSDQAATALGKLSNVLGLTVDDYDNFGAALVDLGNKGASTEAEIIGIAERAGAGASLIDMAADATLGWSAAVANLGIESEAGGSALQRFFLGMTEHVGKAGEELDAVAETAGMTASEFQRAFGQDSSAALQTFIGGMQDLTQAEQLALLELLGFSDVRISRTLLGLAGNTENLNDALAVGAEAWDENTALVEEYGKRADTAAAKIEVLGNRFGDLGRRIGESAPTDVVIHGLDGMVGNFERAFAFLEIGFGENNARMAEWARANNTTIDSIFGEIEGLVAGGMSFDAAFEQATSGVVDIMDDAARASVAAWKQADLGGAVEQDVEKIDDLFSRGGLGVEEAITEEMAEARKAAVEGMAGILDGLNNKLRDGKDGYEASWEAFLEGQKDPFTTAQRTAFIAGQFTGTEFDAGLHSKDPEHVANTVEYVNQQLEEFNVLVPGALQTGKDVPAALQSGMDEIMPELQQYVMDKTGETLDNLSLEEAEQLGIAGIYLYWLGMQSEEQAAADVAAAIATRALNELSIDAYSYGRNAGQTFANGLWASYTPVWTASAAIANAVNQNLKIESEPATGPMTGITQWGGNIVKTITDDMMAHLGLAEGASSALAGALALGDIGGPNNMDFAGGSGSAAGTSAGTGGTVEYHFHTNLVVEGDLRARDEKEIEDAMIRAQRFQQAGVKTWG